MENNKFNKDKRYYHFIQFESNCSIIAYDTRSNIEKLCQKLKYNGLSSFHETLEDLIKNKKIEEKPCKKCGHMYSNHYSHKDLSILGLCFSCDLWTDRSKEQSKAIIVNGTLYSDGGMKKNEENRYLGHGGRYFKIEMNDDRIIETNNLWCGGDIPEIFKKEIPDNAKFLEVK